MAELNPLILHVDGAIYYYTHYVTVHQSNAGDFALDFQFQLINRNWTPPQCLVMFMPIFSQQRGLDCPKSSNGV